MWGCEEHDCERHPDQGDAIYRINPPGEAFRGRCWEHLTVEQRAEHGEDLQQLCQIIQGA